MNKRANENQRGKNEQNLVNQSVWNNALYNLDCKDNVLGLLAYGPQQDAHNIIRREIFIIYIFLY